MRLQRVAVLRKVPFYELATRERGPQWVRVAEDPVVKESFVAHQETMELVHQALRSIAPEVRVYQGHLSEDAGRWADLIVSVGGDGTFLKATHAIADGVTTPILGVNSSPKSSYGYYCAALKESFPELLTSIVEGRAQFRSLWRMLVFINGVPTPTPVLNDVLFAGSVPSETVKYVLRHGKLEQVQKSSGLWVATAAGSTAAVLSAGGRIQPMLSKRFQWRVRELFPPSVQDGLPLNGGVMDGGGELELISRMINARLFVDGTSYTIPVQFGDRIVFRSTETPLTWVSSILCDVHRDSVKQQYRSFQERLKLAETAFNKDPLSE